MSLGMIISLPIFSIFISTLTFCSPDHIQCTGLCRYSRVCILTLTFLFFLNRSWVVPSVMRTKDVWRTTTCVSRKVPSILFGLSFLWFEPVTTPTAVQRIYHLPLSILIHICLLKCPYRDIDLPWSVLSLSWAFSLSLCSPAHDELWLEIFSFIVLPLSVLCLSWASGLSLCSQAHYQL